MPAQPQEMLVQLDAERRSVSYDGYDIIVRQLVDMIRSKEIDISPDYQRHFIWKEDRESELVESILLGIPIPSIYVAVNAVDGTWEVVDGVQRLSTILHFVGDADLLERIKRVEPLKLTGLEKLDTFNEITFAELPLSAKTSFLNRGLRVTALSDRSDFSVRFDLFERLNTGGVGLHAQEIRTILFRGEFVSVIRSLATDKNFRKVVKLGREKTQADYEEAVLRFFAFVENYSSFNHLVKEFLNNYMSERALKGPGDTLVALFKETFAFLASELNQGIVRRVGVTPIALYEAVSVGTALAIQAHGAAKTGVISGLLRDGTLQGYTGAGSNTRRMVTGRIELVRNTLV
jgi:hypothetical protein